MPTRPDRRVTRRALVPVFLPVILLLYGWCADSLLVQLAESQRYQVRLESRRRHLEELRAKAVAGRIEVHEYRSLVAEFQALTSLHASNPFRDPATPSSSSQVASLVSAIQSTLAQQSASRDGGVASLHFLSVSQGGQQSFSPFVAVDFALNLEGRFAGIPGFLDLLAEIGRRRRSSISIGALSVRGTAATSSTGEILITLPIRAYFRE